MGTGAAYTYGPQGRRIARTAGTVTTRYVRDSTDHVWAEYNGTSGFADADLLRRYVYGAGTDVPIALIDETGSGQEISYYHQDRLGSVIAVTDAAGSVAEHYRYDPYGQGIDDGGAVMACAMLAKPSFDPSVATTWVSGFSFTPKRRS